MDRLRQLLNQISAQLGVLSVSQRLAIGLCAALIVGSLLWLMQWSTAADMVPLVTEELTYDDLQTAEDALREGRVSFETRGTRVYVRPLDRHNALRLIHSAGALPQGSLFDIKAAIDFQNPFQAPEERRFVQNYAKGNELAKIIATSPFIKKASVMIEPRGRRRLGAANDVATASVALTTTAGTELSMAMIEGFAKLVAGAVSGLKPHNVAITDSRTGRSYSVPHPDDAMSMDVLGLVKQREAHLLSKIIGSLGEIPGLQAQVSVALDTSKSVKQRQSYNRVQPKRETGESTETSTVQRASEPGVVANMSTAITAGGSGNTSLTEKTETENFEPTLAETETIEELPFSIKKVTAIVGIPRSFIVGIYRARNPDAEAPRDDDAAFMAVQSQQVARVKRSVEKIVMAKSPDDVVVDVYPDMEWTATGGTWSRAPGGMVVAGDDDSVDTLAMVTRYGPQVGVGALALMSMFMMMRVVRASSVALAVKGRGADEVGDDLEGDSEAVLAVGPRTIGTVEASDSLLTGREVDEETLRFQEMGDEVDKVVEQDPDGAAELLRRWIGEDS